MKKDKKELTTKNLIFTKTDFQNWRQNKDSRSSFCCSQIKSCHLGSRWTINYSIQFPGFLSTLCFFWFISLPQCLYFLYFSRISDCLLVTSSNILIIIYLHGDINSYVSGTCFYFIFAFITNLKSWNSPMRKVLKILFIISEIWARKVKGSVQDDMTIKQ